MRVFPLLLLVACAARSPSDAAPPAAAPPATAPTQAPAPAPSAPAAASPAAPLERLTITLDPSEMAYEGTIVRFSPGSRKQAAEYTTYELDLASLEAALGGRPSAPVAVVVEVGPADEKVSTPSDPNMPAPMGGFHYITRRGRVVAKAP
jgi:hypothetical protein